MSENKSFSNFKWLLCPDCKKEICQIVSLSLSHNNIPMINIKCPCRNEILNISLEYFFNDINKSPFNTIGCIKHPNIKECYSFCLDCVHWLCSECDNNHEKSHIKYYMKSMISNKCKIHRTESIKGCYINEDILVCDQCIKKDTEKYKNFKFITIRELWDETFEKLKFKTTEDVINYFENEKKSLENVKNQQIKYVNLIIEKFEYVKNEIEQMHLNNIKISNYYTNLIYMIYSNFLITKTIPNYNAIKNIKLIKFPNNNIDYSISNSEINLKKDSIDLIISKIISKSQEFFNSNLLIKNILQIEKENIKKKNKLSFIPIKFSKQKNFFKKCIHTIKAHENAIYSVIELQNGNIASCSSDYKIKIWSMNTYSLISTFEGHNSTILSLCQLKDSRLVSSSEDTKIKIWNLNTEKLDFELNGNEAAIYTIKQLENLNLISGSYDSLIKIWDLNLKTCIKIYQGHLNIIYKIIEIKKNLIASSSYDKTIKIWDLNNNIDNNCKLTLYGHSSFVWGLAKINDKNYPNQNLIASGSTDQTIKVWNVENGNNLYTLNGHCFTVISIIQSSNGNLISGSYDNTIKIWSLENKMCITTLHGHNNAVWDLTQLKNGKLVTGSWDKTIKIWE